MISISTATINSGDLQRPPPLAPQEVAPRYVILCNVAEAWVPIIFRVSMAEQNLPVT